MPAETRGRIRDSATELFRRQGLHGTGVKQIVAGAAAPLASLYHFYPGGKDELAADVIRTAGQGYEDLVASVWDAAPDVVTSVRAVFDGAAAALVATDYADVCPIETIALEVASTNETLRRATAEVFESWIAVATSRFVAAGLDAGTARELAFRGRGRPRRRVRPRPRDAFDGAVAGHRGRGGRRRRPRRRP